MSDIPQRICAFVSIDNIVRNLENMHEHLRKVRGADASDTDPVQAAPGAASDTHPGSSVPGIVAVIKADGYGHGALAIARRLEGLDFIWGYAVATLDEAMELRRDGMKKPVLILGFVFPGGYEDIVRYDIRPAVFKYETALALSQEGARQKKDVNIHIKLDTGMGRIGYLPTREAADEIKRIAALPNIVTEGLFTHLARADESDLSAAGKQIDIFDSFTDNLASMGVTFRLRHFLNSAGILRLAGRGGELVRAGITMYGLWPSPEVERDIIDIYPAMRIVSHIAYIKNVPEGTPVSYGGTFVSEHPMRIATIPTGYADGYPRSLSGCGDVLIRGRRAPILGRVCMDQFMVDVTHIPEAAEYDEVVLVGKDGDEEITFEEWQERSSLLNYELACHIGKRVPRRMQSEGL